MSKGQKIVFIALLGIYLLVMSVLFHVLGMYYPMLISLFLAWLLWGKHVVTI